jgi:hypothetical protein
MTKTTRISGNAILARYNSQTVEENIRRLRKMTDREVRLENLPHWHVGGDLLKYKAILKMRIKEGIVQKERIVYDLSTKLGEIDDCIHEYAYSVVYYPEAYNPRTGLRKLRPGYNHSDFSFTWFQLTNQWATEYYRREMSEETYTMLMNEKTEKIFDKIKSGNFKLKDEYKIRLRPRIITK